MATSLATKPPQPPFAIATGPSPLGAPRRTVTASVPLTRETAQPATARRAVAKRTAPWNRLAKLP